MAEIVEIAEEKREPTIARVSEIQKQAEELKKKTELPKKPGDRVLPSQLHEWLQLLTTEQEQQIVIYVYRLDPPIIRQKTNPDAPNNVDVISDGYKTLDVERYLIDTQGGGKYQLIVKNQGYKPKAKVDNNGYFESIVTIPHNLHPTKLSHIDRVGLDLREVDWDNDKARNFKAWALAQGLIDKDCKMIEGKPNGAPTTILNGGIDPTTFKMMLDFTAKMSEKEQVALKRQIGGEDALSKSMGDLMLEKMKQDNPNTAAATMIQMITAIKGMNPEPKPDNTLAVIMPMFMQMMTMANEAANRQMTMMLEMFKANARPEKEEGSKIEELKAIVELAKEIKSGHSSNVDKTFTESIIEAIPSLLQVAGNVTSMMATAKGVPSANIAEVITNKPQGASNFRTLHEQNTMNPQTAPQNGQQQLPPPNEAAQIVANYGPLIMNKLGSPGWEFGESVADLFGDATAAQIVKHGPEALLAAAKSVTPFWEKIQETYGEAHFKKWLDSLCNFREIVEQYKAEEMEPEEEKK